MKTSPVDVLGEVVADALARVHVLVGGGRAILRDLCVERQPRTPLDVLLQRSATRRGMRTISSGGREAGRRCPPLLPAMIGIIRSPTGGIHGRPAGLQMV
jgi:hypothetical protein